MGRGIVERPFNSKVEGEVFGNSRRRSNWVGITPTRRSYVRTVIAMLDTSLSLYIKVGLMQSGKTLLLAKYNPLGLDANACGLGVSPASGS